MSINDTNKIKFKVPNDVARIMKQWGGHNVKLAAARGALPMSGPNLVTVLFIFYHGTDVLLRKEALKTLKDLAPGILKAVCGQDDVHPEILDLLARLHYPYMEVMEPLLTNRMVGLKTLMFVAEHASGGVLDLLASNETVIRQAEALRLLIINNPHADKVMKLRLGWKEEVVEPSPETAATNASSADDSEEQQELIEEIEEEELSKYQQLLDMVVSEKIKMALTGDKEWRTLLIRESNKLVSSAVLKNPRISDGEVLMVAKSRTSSEELIRMITLNREWVKNYETKKALIENPRTPLQLSMRYMSFMGVKDLKNLAKSRNIAQALVNNARRILMNKKI